jgi:hypothetical protein
MGLKQKKIHDAGITSTTKIADTGAYMGTNNEMNAPKSNYAITETSNLVFTNRIVGRTDKNLNIADGQRRPGTRG